MRRRVTTASGCVLVAVVLVVGATIGIGLTSLVVGLVIGFIAVADDIFIRPVLAVESAIIVLPVAPRLLFFGVWLLLTLGSALLLLYLLSRKRPTDHIVVVLTACLGSVLVSISLTAWLMLPLVRIPFAELGLPFVQ